MTTSSPCSRRSRSPAVSMAWRLPPWLLLSTSRRTPQPARAAPMRTMSAARSPDSTCRVPASPGCACSVLAPTGSSGSTRSGKSSGSRRTACASRPRPTSASVDSGRWGPCCSTAASGSTSTGSRPAMRCASGPVSASQYGSGSSGIGRLRPRCGGSAAAPAATRAVVGRRSAPAPARRSRGIACRSGSGSSGAGRLRPRRGGPAKSACPRGAGRQAPAAAGTPERRNSARS